MYIEEQKNCRICKSSELSDVIDLGSIYPSSFLRDDEKVSEESKAPLVLCRCSKCGLFQLRHTINLDLMYRQYWYSSSLNKSMVSSLKDIINEVENRGLLQNGDTVVDIGCNDGTLLNLYSDLSLNKVGYDPALNLEKPKGIYFINDYFSSGGYFDVHSQLKAKVITAIAMFYDLPDPNNFVREVKSILHEDGVFVIQFTDLLSMIKATAFDNICHEHLEYYRLVDVINLLATNGLQVIDVSYNDVNGGSVRITAAMQGRYPAQETVKQSLDNEEKFLLANTIDSFRDRIDNIKHTVQKFLKHVKKSRKTIMLLGASTKGNTLLQVYGITKDDIPFAAEVNKDKFGLRTAGSDIKIISEEQALEMKPDFLFVPVWHFKKNIVSNPKIVEYVNNGGVLVFPLPNFEIIGGTKFLWEL